MLESAPHTFYLFSLIIGRNLTGAAAASRVTDRSTEVLMMLMIMKESRNNLTVSFFRWLCVRVVRADHSIWLHRSFEVA